MGGYARRGRRRLGATSYGAVVALRAGGAGRGYWAALSAPHARVNYCANSMCAYSTSIRGREAGLRPLPHTPTKSPPSNKRTLSLRAVR